MLTYDDLLDAQDQSKYLLSDARAAGVVLESWRYMHEARWCRVIVVCVMGNHVHVVLEGWAGEEEVPLREVIGKHKTHCSMTLRRLGFKSVDGYDSFWASSFFDRYVRAGFIETVVEYVIDNPKKAGLVRDGRSWPFTWVPGDARLAASGLRPGRT